MNIWHYDSISAPCNCKVAQDYKLHFPAWRTSQRVGHMENDKNETNEPVPWRKVPHSVGRK